MPTVLELYADALSEIRALQPQQTPSGAMTQFVQRKQAEMLRSWSMIRLRLFYIPEATYTLANAVGSYQIGPGVASPGFDTTPGVFVRPEMIQSARVIVGNGRRWPLNLLTRPQWDTTQYRGLTDPDGPLDLFYDSNAPTATINVAPIPNNPQTLLISQWNPLKTFAVGEESFNVEDYYPQDYIRAIRLGLAIELAPSFGFQVSQELAQLSAAALQTIEQRNNETLSGSFGLSRTGAAPLKGDGQPVQQG